MINIHKGFKVTDFQYFIGLIIDLILCSSYSIISHFHLFPAIREND